MVEISWHLRKNLLWTFPDVFQELLSNTMGHRHGFIVSNMFSNKQFFLGGRHGDDLPLDLGVNHASFKLIVNRGITRHSLIIVFLIILASNS